MLGHWSAQSCAGRVTINDSSIITERDPDTVRGADVAYFRMDRLPEGKLPRMPGSVAPDRCVEVLSTSDRWQEVQQRIAVYLASGVREVWIVNPGRKTLEVFLPEEAPTLYRESDILTSPLLPGTPARWPHAWKASPEARWVSGIQSRGFFNQP